MARGRIFDEFLKQLVSELSLQNTRRNNSISVSSCDSSAAEMAKLDIEDLSKSPAFLQEQEILLARCRGSQRRHGTATSHEEARSPGRLERIDSIGIELTCAICLESLSSAAASGKVKMVTKCGHVFCRVCIETWVKNHDRSKAISLCPICRMDVGELRIIHL